MSLGRFTEWQFLADRDYELAVAHRFGHELQRFLVEFREYWHHLYRWVLRGAIASLPPLDAVADTVGGRSAEKLIAKVKPGGVFASVARTPENAAKYPAVKVAPVFSKFDRKTLQFMAEAVRDGKLIIPISQTLPLSKAAEAQAAAEKGGIGKILLVA